MSAPNRRQIRPAPKAAGPPSSPGVASRRLALEVLGRIEADGAYANLALKAALDRAKLADSDRGLATELVYGTTRMRRACDALVEPWLTRELDADVRNALRLGVYQLAYLGTPPHAAVDATVGALGGKAKGLVNAVLRRVAAALAEGAFVWPDLGTELSYPDWIVESLVASMGADEARKSLETMNRAASVHVRADGYIQDRASELVVAAVGALQGEVVLDLCAAPGGKATGLAALGPSLVVGADLRPSRVRLMARNAAQVGAEHLALVVADGTQPPFRTGCADRVLIDAPCSGLGTLRRRADARWRIDAPSIDRLVPLQRALLGAAMALLKPGGVLVFSVCTLTVAETIAQDEWLAHAHPAWLAVDPPGDPWRAYGRGARLAPHETDSDGMYLLALRKPVGLA